MVNKISTKFLIYPLFTILALYLISILFFNHRVIFVAGITFNLCIILIVALSLRYIENNKIYYKFYLVAIIADSLPNILYTLSFDHIKNITDTIYLIPNIIYFGWLIIFIFRELKNWNKYQFFSDIFIIATIGSTIVWSLFIIRYTSLININYSLAVIIIYIFLDFGILSICALLFLSKGIKNTPKNLILPLLAVLIYSLRLLLCIQ